MKHSKLIGRRVIKTGVAVFITAWICRTFDLPVMFAVITAIVTTEPTAADSIKKGIVRLPAAAIGALFAIVCDLLIGHSALTYAMVSMLTIVACYRFKLDYGTLVATLTAVAMIPGTSEGFFIDFFTRLSGTSIGIIVSTLVNFVVLPPKFGPIVVHKVNQLFIDTAKEIYQYTEQFPAVSLEDSNPIVHYRTLSQEIDKTYQLTTFQYDEWKYRKFHLNEKRSFQFLQKKLHILQKTISHIGNLRFIEISKQELSRKDIKVIQSSCEAVAMIFEDPLHSITAEQNSHINEMKTYLTKRLQFEQHTNTLHPVTMVFYELLSLLLVAEQLSELTIKEKQFSNNETTYPKYIFQNQVQYD
ncbi:FUSC family protein [Desertibacillus haloalkaliphilus]|uniref:FUSC family protein n=1 Tax=Desertibacillus haloalkaliphilus TaxID=1328930 RepID=UPI001C255219|nr:aromatic acid exporter family protein [Desertibacillus haloalkaliphilus]MBU8906749.1 FUSC family protein [Desertibacillus haloalkaliphilus]